MGDQEFFCESHVWVSIQRGPHYKMIYVKSDLVVNPSFHISLVCVIFLRRKRLRQIRYWYQRYRFQKTVCPQVSSVHYPNETSYRILYTGLGTSLEIDLKLECNFQIWGHTKKNDKNNKESKRLQLQGRLEKLGSIISLQRRMRGDLIGTFKVINGIYNNGRHFSRFLRELEIYY